MEYTDLETCEKDWADLGIEFKALETLNKEYIAKLEEVGELQAKCLKELNHQRYRLSVIKRSLKRVRNADQEKLETLEKDFMRRKAQLYEMEQSLPKQNGTYLKIILGNVNVSILNKNDKFKYKDEYEKFKLILSVIGFVLAVINLVVNVRALELAFMFLLVWYYCTLTIRESILKVNGSRIKGWWRLHHFISTVLAGVLLIWPNTLAWYEFRTQFMWFNVYISLVQYLQFRYQQGVLYRLKALGERHNMDITIEGFHSWMWRGLSFLLPFLYMGYLFQLYNAYALYHLCYHAEATWQVPVLSILFLVLFLGNTVTTSMVIPQKLREKVKLNVRFTRQEKGSRNSSNMGSRQSSVPSAISSKGNAPSPVSETASSSERNEMFSDNSDSGLIMTEKNVNMRTSEMSAQPTHSSDDTDRCKAVGGFPVKGEVSDHEDKKSL
ncbi:transmembrane protein 120 homolog [Ischnura elegans]|uniref:transmembrane protein 120 homolog n=1 Tax=Ischnura elegans TaxID=197161 RepID=UPI001ED8A54D|nr:transmembrane protein 120 homolog [Ischnura elegans]XP_046396519.1 transmembrane protein 120 homolog [Ischnura elegans]